MYQKLIFELKTLKQQIIAYITIIRIITIAKVNNVSFKVRGIFCSLAVRAFKQLLDGGKFSILFINSYSVKLLSE